MIKNLFSAFMLLHTMAISQTTTLFTQDFQSGGMGTMTMYNDNNTPDDETTFNAAWINARWTMDGEDTNRVASSTSYFTSTGVAADRWLVTPAITIPASVSSARLIFKARAHVDDPGFPDGFKLRLSSTTNDKSAFTTTLLSVTAAPNQIMSSIPSTIVDLTAHKGKTIYLAWVNDNLDKYIISIDNILVTTEGTLGLDEPNEKTEVQIFPNPVSSEFKVISTKKIQKVSLTDISGKIVKEFTNASESYDISSLQSGAYMISVETEKGTETKKIIKK